MMKSETLEELVEQRRGYKYLNKDFTSPYQNFQYDKRKRIFKTDDLNEDLSEDCGSGFNLATLDWILRDSARLLSQIIVEYSVPAEAKIIVPHNSTGKFRTDIIIKEKVYEIEDLFPKLKWIQKKLKSYKPVNFITAKKLPPKSEMKEIMAQVRAQVWAQTRAQIGAKVQAKTQAQVRAKVRAQTRDQIRDQVWNQIRDQIRVQIRDQIRAKTRDQIWDQIWAQIWAKTRAQVRPQVRDQIRIASYYAVKEFLNLDYDHPAFDLVRLGIVVVSVSGKFKVFGNGGQFLGELDE